MLGVQLFAGAARRSLIPATVRGSANHAMTKPASHASTGMGVARHNSVGKYAFQCQRLDGLARNSVQATGRLALAGPIELDCRILSCYSDQVQYQVVPNLMTIGFQVTRLAKTRKISALAWIICGIHEEERNGRNVLQGQS